MIRMLVVDADPAALDDVAKALREEGHAVTEAASADEARAARPGEFDVAVIDLLLPKDVGMALAVELLGGQAVERVVFYTGGAPAPSVRRAALFGPVVAKGTGTKVLVDVVRRVCEGDRT